MFKKFFFLSLLMPLTSFASELAICALKAEYYVTNSRYEYVFKSSEVLEVSQRHHNGEVVVLSGVHYPVSYEVVFRAYKDITGGMRVKIDQPGDQDRGQVVAGKDLNLSVEDYYNGGKTVYRLNCQMI